MSRSDAGNVVIGWGKRTTANSTNRRAEQQWHRRIFVCKTTPWAQQLPAMAATFTALNAAPAFLTGRKVVSKARAGPAPRSTFQVSAAASQGRRLWAPGAWLSQPIEHCRCSRSRVDLANRSIDKLFSDHLDLHAYHKNSVTIRIPLLPRESISS